MAGDFVAGVDAAGFGFFSGACAAIMRAVDVEGRLYSVAVKQLGKANVAGKTVVIAEVNYALFAAGLALELDHLLSHLQIYRKSGRLLYSKRPLLCFNYLSRMAAWAAARRAIGTRKGEQLT